MDLAVFDCDGVLLDSNPVKIAAFRQALAGEPPERVEAFLADHRASGGVSRFVKFERFYREWPVADPEAAIAAALVRFAAAARAGLRTCPAIPGVADLLGRLAEQGTAIHVISGGEEREVSEALVERGWAELFAGIHGSPTTKHQHMQRLRSEGRLPAGGIYFGDAELDMQMAEAFDLRFVFVAGTSEWQSGRALAAARGHAVIEDFLSWRADQPGSQ